MAATIKQRISFEGSEEARKKLEELGRAGAAAFNQIQAAASKPITDPAQIDKITQSVNQLGAAMAKAQPQLQRLAGAAGAQGFGQAAAGLNATTKAAGGTAAAVANTAAAASNMNTVLGLTTKELKLASAVLNQFGAGPLTGLGVLLSRVSIGFGGLIASVAGLGIAGATLFKFAQDAADAAAKLDAVAKAGNVSFEFLSSLQGVFARGGTSLDKFTQEFGNLSDKILEARTQLAQMRAGPEATQAANDIGNLTTKFRNLAAGIPQTFSPLTTLESKVKAVIDAVSGAQVLGPFGQQLAQTAQQSEAAFLRLADVFKNLSSDMERAQIGKALGLSPQTIATLSLGAAAIRQMQADVRQLGLSLSDLDKRNLAGVTAATAQLGSLWDALKAKMGAAAAPAFTSFLEGLTSALQQASPELRKLAQAFGQLDFRELGRTLGEAGVAVAKFFADLASQLAGGGGLQGSINQLGTTVAPTATQVGVSIGQGIVDGMLNAVSAGLASLADTIGRYLEILPQLFVAELMTNARILQANFAALLSGTPVQPPDLSDINAAIQKLKADAGLAGKQIANSIGQGAQTGVNQASRAVSDLGTATATAVAPSLDEVSKKWEELTRVATAANFPVTQLLQLIPAGAYNSASALQSVIDSLNGIMRAAQAAEGAVEMMNGVLVDASGPGFGTPGVGSGTAGIGSGYGGFAGGGLMGGRGTGTSDSNLAWLSRGEYITPARAVRQPGVLSFLEALRRSGGNLRGIIDDMGHFARGGLVLPAFAAGGLNGGMNNVTIQFPGLPAVGGLRASSEVVEQLQKSAALAQVRSGGRKPSRYS